MSKARQRVAVAVVIVLALGIGGCAHDRQPIFPRGGNLFSRFRPRPKPEPERIETELPPIMPDEVKIEDQGKAGVPMLRP